MHRNAKIHTDLNVSDPIGRSLYHKHSMNKHRIAIGVKEVMQTKLLTLVQVGVCWKYALEAIIIVLFISTVYN